LFFLYSNLLKVTDTTDQGETIRRLGYIDFGLLSTVPVTVRDGLVCAVAELVFARNASAVADLFGELQLIPEEILSDPSQRAALAVELNQALTSVLKYDRPATGAATAIPTLRFDKLLDALTRLVPRFRFQLPPYFINNARALGTLEGMAREINPSFNVLQTLYPYVLRRLLSNPTDSPVVEATLQSLIRSPVTGRVDSRRVQKLLDDSTILTGYSKRKVLSDILKSRNGPRLVKLIIKEQLRHTFRGRFSKMANYLRL
jgi:predicted unusual protein kinase regulating ubiquinone biosynthesis (AarF/ABC1/UbiB family)